MKDITGQMYGSFCQSQTTRGKCKEFYIGEREGSLKNSLSGHHIDLDEVKILDREPRWFEKGAKEVIYIQVNKPKLNKDGGRYKLPGVYESILTSSVPKVTTWDSLTLADERRRIFW